MADKKKNAPPAAPAPAAAVPTGQANQPAGQPSIQIISQYVKDASFENPHAPESIVSGWAAPETSVQIALGQKPIKDNLFESSMHFRIEAKNKADGRMAFIIDLH